MTIMERRRAVMAMLAKDWKNAYVQNGLIFWLDGKTAVDSNTWTDLIGNRVFTLTNCQANANGVYFNGSAYGVCNSNNIDGQTIEAAYSLDGTDHSVSVFGQYNRADEQYVILLRSKQTGNIYTRAIDRADPCKKYPLQQTEIISAYFGGSGAVVNGNQTASSSIDKGYIGVTNSLVIGRPDLTSSVNWALKGTLHSVRIYNRFLTAEEISQNQRADDKRFNLGVFA